MHDMSELEQLNGMNKCIYSISISQLRRLGYVSQCLNLSSSATVSIPISLSITK